VRDFKKGYIVQRTQHFDIILQFWRALAILASPFSLLPFLLAAGGGGGVQIRNLHYGALCSTISASLMPHFCIIWHIRTPLPTEMEPFFLIACEARPHFWCPSPPKSRSPIRNSDSSLAKICALPQNGAHCLAVLGLWPNPPARHWYYLVLV